MSKQLHHSTAEHKICMISWYVRAFYVQHTVVAAKLVTGLHAQLINADELS